MSKTKIAYLAIIAAVSIIVLVFSSMRRTEGFESAPIVNPAGSVGWNGQEATPTGNPASRETYLTDMVKYLLLVINMTNARQQLYKLENGYAQTFSSPRLDALEKQRQFFIEKVKQDPAELAFFRENLVVLI